MKMGKHCRLWWPRQLISNHESSSSFLLGWFVTCSPSSLDIVVAFTCSEVLFSNSSPGIEEIIHGIHGGMPTILNDRSVFSVLGMCITGTTSNSLTAEADVDKKKFFDCGNTWAEGSTSVHRQNKCKSCSFLQLDGSLRKSSQSFIGKSNWVVLMFDSSEQNNVGTYRLPKLHHIHCNGLTLSEYDVHVIVYETPSYGVHHFSLCHFGSNEQAKTPIKNPKWIDELHKKQKFVDLDTVILAINCTSAAKRIFDRHVVPRRSLSQLSLFSMFFVIIGHLFCKFLASFSTVFYIVLQFFQTYFNRESESWLYLTSVNVFKKTAWINIRIRCCQILYWPILLQENDLRSQSCVEYAEKAAMHRHSMWSSLVVDILLGNLVGWLQIECRAGRCTWYAFVECNPNMIVLGTLHVSTLHWFISIVYSSQIQALAALWRLFRGRKWNPLRQRLDSFDYTVKQHIVGSLLFTPLLLLLPTTSVFYIFFSIVDTTINLICILIEITISVIHATPYIKIFLWLTRPGRFPCGIWLETFGCQRNHTASTNQDFANEINSSKESLHLKGFNIEKSSILVSILRSNYLSIGKVISPHYRNAFLGVSGSSISKVAHGILIGQRMPYMRGTLLPSPMPWMSLPYKKYWRLCHDSLIACFR
ncbi:N-acetylglucosaminyl transferase component family protein / Gpi1 family protein [Trifolium repens]|nr:N-acetylglucosaminyl transferase component family protein / Gpi1 family protein [Trifolium repens]